MKRVTVLVVEDNEVLLENIREIFEYQDVMAIDIFTAENGARALEVLNGLSTPLDLILSDIRMPVMDGIAFLAAVRDNPRWQNVPFIFLSAESEQIEIDRGLKLGATDYIPKPYTVDGLIERVCNHLVSRASANGNPHQAAG
jgi:CheY-like chemotaxis protein